MILKLQFALVFLISLLFAPAATDAQWQRTSGPEGGAIAAIVSDGATLYAATGTSAGGASSVGDVYRSTDLGKTWVSIGSDIPGSTSVNCFAVNTNAFYCGTHSGLFRKMKTGSSWDSLAPLPSGYPIRSVLVSDTDIIAYASFSGLYRSRDDGKTWAQLDLGNLQNTSVNAIDRIGSTIFLATQGQGIYVSTNNGASWAVKNGKITGEDLYVSSLHHINGVEFAGTLRGVFNSLDLGDHWDSCRNGIPSEFGPQDFASHSGNNDTIFASVSSMGIYYSVNFGANWIAMNSGIPQYTPTSALAYCSGYLFSGISMFGIIRAQTDTKVWEKATYGISNTSVFGIDQFDVSGKGNVMFAGASDNDFGLGWISSDKGVTWTSIDSMSERGVTCFGTKDGTIFAGTFGDGIYVSSDGGVKWTSRALEIPGASYINAFASAPSAVVAAISGNVGVLHSTDLGTTWTTPLSASGAFINTVFYDADSHTLFAGSNFGIFTSADDGATWVRPKTSIDSVTIFSFARVGNTLVAGSWFGLYRSTDNGVTWALADQATKKTKFNTLYVIGTDIYAGVKGDVLVSHDQGSNWQSFQTGIPKTMDVLSLSWDEANLYAGTSGYGVMKTPLLVPDAVREDHLSVNILSTRYSGTQAILHYVLPTAEYVTLKLLTVTGQDLLTLFDGFQQAGEHEFILTDAVTSKLASGMYFAELRANGILQSTKVLVRK